MGAKITKIYEGKRFLEIQKNVMVERNGTKKLESIEFTNGSKVPTRKNPKYITSDPAIQKALEKHPDFKSKFFLVKETKEELAESDKNPIQEFKGSEVKEKEEAGDDDKVTLDDLDDGEEEASDDPVQLVEEVETLKAAKEWLAKEKGAKISHMRNRTEILAEADKHNVEFPNIPAE